jgi:hypothetical protein
MALCLAYDSGELTLQSKSLVCLKWYAYTMLYVQNDLVHGWGLDFALRKCVEVFPAIIMHNTLPEFLLISKD